MYDPQRSTQGRAGAGHRAAAAELPAPGKRTLVSALQASMPDPAPVQRKAGGAPGAGALDLPTSGGQPLPEAVRAKMERAFRADFSAVRVFEGPEAAAVGALAFTRGTNLFFAPGQYRPETAKGQELLGHELAHVVQQAAGRVQATQQAKGVAINEDHGLEHEADVLGARAARGEDGAPRGEPAARPVAARPGAVAQGKCATCGGADAAAGELEPAADDLPSAKLGATARPPAAQAAAAAGGCAACGGGAIQAKADAALPVIASSSGAVAQRWPGDGMNPPGDCNMGLYTGLRAAVVTAKAAVSALGACSGNDSCELLAAKIAAMTTEIAARVTLDTTCFRGGNTGHRDEVQNKVNALNRCYKVFQRKTCDQELMRLTAAAAAAAAGAAAATTSAAASAAAAALAVLQFVADVVGGVVIGLLEVLGFLLRLGQPA
jgi:hypothetical protein